MFILGLILGFAMGWLIPVPGWFTALVDKYNNRK
jgi:hypothetical protein